MTTLPSILVLGGGPDSEREVSLNSARMATAALERAGYRLHNQTIDRLSIGELAALPGEVIFPLLHGGWGEGGPLQDLLEADGRPFVASGSRAARAAMDKVATKFAAQALGIVTTVAHIVDLRDTVCPLPYPVVLKPVHDGSTIGLYICRSDEQWAEARQKIDRQRIESLGTSTNTYMIEPCVTGEHGKPARELTVGLLDGKALPIIEILPAAGVYDYQAKYTRNDTRYVLDPRLPSGVAERVKRDTERLAAAMGIRHVARADFMLDGDGQPWFLEINTTPGFTDHSLVPMAARHLGIEMPELCARLVQMAVRDAQLADKPGALA